MKNKKNQNYYVGLDIGTNSVGYAVCDENYELLKFKGEQMWGVTVFDESKTAAERRAFRSARRRLDRRRQRVTLINDLFAREIGQIDADFFIRLQRSRLYPETKEDAFRLFPTMDEHREYCKKYPTIHHLIDELMNSAEQHDVRLVYLACAWLVSHRGHFLYEVDKDNINDILNFDKLYEELGKCVGSESSPFRKEVTAKQIGSKIKSSKHISEKEQELKKFLGAEDSESPYNAKLIVKLMSGGKCSKLAELFAPGKYDAVDLGSCSMGMDEESFSETIAKLDDDDRDLMLCIKKIYDWSVLSGILGQHSTISQAKIATYNQHKQDKKWLKYFIKKYLPQRYNEIFKDAAQAKNYVAYSYHTDGDTSKLKKASKAEFCDYIGSIMKDIECDDGDKKIYEDMMDRITAHSFMPKQRDGDNSVIPYQLYYQELKTILANAETYLLFLRQKDEKGLSVSDKIASVFLFRVPYYVGPLVPAEKSPYAWMVRKTEGKIFPWNFDEKVDKDKSEESFIRRMTNTCAYLPGASALPKQSLLYQAFEVLNEINKLKIDGENIDVKTKQNIFDHLFKCRKKVTKKQIKDYLVSRGVMTVDQRLNIEEKDFDITTSLSSYIAFREMLDNGKITEHDAENIIERLAYTEDRVRFRKWVEKYSAEHAPRLTRDDLEHIGNLRFRKSGKNFGSLSKALLFGSYRENGEEVDGIYGIDKESGTGECMSVIRALWETNCNLNELLASDTRFTFKSELDRIKQEYYDQHKMSLSEYLSENRISGGIRRSIIRTLDITEDIVKVLGRKAPTKIFVEVTRDGNKSGKKPLSRADRINEFYRKISDCEARKLGVEMRVLRAQLEQTGNDKLQRELVFLYFMQLGKDMYTGESISLENLFTKENLYDKDHIYPQHLVKDDSITNNLVLVNSVDNQKTKGDKYPIPADIRNRMIGFWDYLHKNKLLNDEKYHRLTRCRPFTDDEKYEFINRQLVETGWASKAVAEILQNKYPESEIVYVKARLVSDFRQQYNMLKSRLVNDLHHAKDAYLNIVCGNVYHCKFTKRFFDINRDKYDMKTCNIYGHAVERAKWRGQEQIGAIRKTVMTTPRHYTKYAFCRYGGLFDQTIYKKGSDLIPIKKGLDTEKYGGYKKSTASYFTLVKYTLTSKTGKSKTDILIMPVELMFEEKFSSDDDFALAYAAKAIPKKGGEIVSDISFPLGKRKIKINTVLSLDGYRACISGKTGTSLQLSSLTPFIAGYEKELYIKKLEAFIEKQKANSNIKITEEYDKITKKENLELYDCFTEKLNSSVYSKRPNSQKGVIESGREKFISATAEEQAKTLLMILQLFGRCDTVDLQNIGGAKNAGKNTISQFLSNLRKTYSDIRIIDQSASGLFESISPNLLGML